MPDWERVVRAKLPALHVRPEREREIVAELAIELEQVYGDALAGGAGETEAALRAQEHLGDWQALGTRIDQAERGNSRASLSAGGLHDVRYALRALRKNPGFAAIAVLTLAFGIGGNTAIFTMVDAVALRNLPYRDPDRLMAIETRKVQQPEIEPWTSAPDFLDFRKEQRSFESVVAISPVWNVVMTGRGAAEQLDSLYVSADFFPMLGVTAALGRTFLPEEDINGKPAPVVVLGNALWQRRFGGRRDVIGQQVAIDNSMYNVIGVLPADFRWAGEPLAGTSRQIQAWFPLAANQLALAPRMVRFLKVTGRLKQGVKPKAAREETHRLVAALAEQHPDTDRGFECDIRPLRDQATGRVRTSMLLLLGTVAFVLLMACANVANLLLARAVARQREISVRIAVGASAWRLVRQLLTEGLVLAALGGAVGIPMAYVLLQVLVAVGPESLMQAHEISLDARALAFTSAAVLFCAIAAGLPPALRIAAADAHTALRAAGRGMVGGNHRLRSALVVMQVAVALVLLVGAGLLIRSFQHLMSVDPGIDPHNLVTIATQMPGSARTPELRAEMLRRIQDRLEALPGVMSTGAVSRLPFTGKNLGTLVFVEGHSAPGQPLADVEYRVATPNYFPTMRIPLRAGRLFDDHDGAASPVAIINETMARKFWPGEDPVGRRIKLSSTPERAPWFTVVGVVGDVRHFGLDTEPRAEVYRSYAVNPLGAPILVIRTRTDAGAMVETLGATVRSVDPEIPTYDMFAMEALVERSTVQRRFVMMLLTGFALAALLLAGVGIYGTISQAVAQRTQEIGVRMALGASPVSMMAMVFGDGMRLAGVGLATGWIAAAALSGWMRSLLFDVKPFDPLVFGAGAAVLAAFALLACYVPARRATRVDPMIALRQE
uniref:Permease n=1 Tax=Solibacter usitatus (strain Ellin6076) TaxID=234267 RepID=Q027Q2_SOLUE